MTANEATEFHQLFRPLDWVVVIGYLLLTTFVGHLFRGKQSSIKDFFLGGRSLPWPAVCGSIIATEISGVTFIGVAGGLLAYATGNMTYMLWGIGSILGRVLVAVFFVPRFYEEEIYSPYDYMERRLGSGLKKLATFFFTLGSILGQSVRVLVAALPLMVVTGMRFEICILIIGIFAIAWTLMGGMRTVIWTDVMQFGLFTFGGLLALFWIIGEIDGGWGRMMEIAGGAGKTQMIDMTWGFDRSLVFTFWVAVIAVPFQNLTAFGVDQLNAQRMFCCKNQKDAAKALIFSSVGQLLTLLMLYVGAALFVFYQQHPPEGAVAAALNFDKDGVPSDGDSVFPIWIVSELPPGLSGLILAGVFAAAISSLDSILAALSQTTMSVLYKKEAFSDEASAGKMVNVSRAFVVFWGLALTAFTLLLKWMKDQTDVPILPLAFGMTAYTMGPMLAFFLGALWRKSFSFRGLLVGSLISLVVTAFWRMEFYLLLDFFLGKGHEGLKTFFAGLPTYELTGDEQKLASKWAFPWLWPLTCLLTLGFGALIPGPKEAKGATS